MIGIYKFTNKLNGQVYIGQSIQIEHRYQEHINEANQDRRNSKWYNALRKYGIENFDFEILEECLPEELNDKEVYWISYYNSYNNGYNSTPGGQEKIFDPQKIYDAWDKGLSVSEISELLGIGHSTIRNNLLDYKKYSVEESNRRGGNIARKKALNKQENFIYQYELNGNFIKKWNSCKEIARKLNYNAGLIGKCISEERKTAYNFQWKNYYKEKIEPYKSKMGKPTKVIQYDKNWNEIKRYNTIAEAARITYTDPSLISRVCKNGNFASGFHWKYADD